MILDFFSFILINICKSLDVKQRIELIQGFEMPMLSGSISMTRDGQYIFVAGKSKD